MRRAAIVFCIIGVLTASLSGQDVGTDPEVTFESAVETYSDGRYALALEQFAQLAELEPDAGRRSVLHANAGTAAARDEQWGEATWHLEAAWRAHPGDPRVRRNLAQVHALDGDGTDTEPSMLVRLARLPLWMTETAVSYWIGGLAALAILLLTVCRAQLAGRRTVWSAVIVAIAAGGLAIGSDASRSWDARRAVVIEGVAVRAEPTPSGRVLFRLPAGAVVQDEELRDSWRLIETTAGARGWVPVELVRAAGS